MHPISRHLEQAEITQAEFARRMDISPQLVNDLIKGRCNIGRETALRMVERTGGDLQLHELLAWDTEGVRVA